MIHLLARLFIKNYTHTEDETVRRQYGILCSIAGICFNVLLFAGKYLAGMISGSVAIMADAVNNLSDAGSSFITLIGFRIAGKRADKGHPFGHGRMEYVSGLIVSMIILLMGIEILKDSADKIFHPQEVDTGVLAFAVLAASICVKLYMACYNRSFGRRLQSAAMEATALDSFSDVAATAVVLVSMLISRFWGINLDGYGGVIVALFILYAGFSAAKETLNPLLGQAPDKELVEEIRRIVLAHEEILGIHDLIVHDYGPGHRLISLHGEVSGEENIYVLHDVIDRIERELSEKLSCEAVIHMDPIPVNDKHIREMREQLAEAVRVIHPQMTCHDLHLMKENDKEYVGFDVILPEGCGLTDQEMVGRLRQLVHVLWGDVYEPIIKIDYE